MNRDRLVRQLVHAGKKALSRYLRPPRRQFLGPQEPQFEDPRGIREPRYHPSRREQEYPGDYAELPVIEYEPVDDDRPDPGEVVWTWVPFEEDYDQGKDRPVLVIGRDEPWLLALQASTVNDDEHRDRERQQGRYWWTSAPGSGTATNANPKCASTGS